MATVTLQGAQRTYQLDLTRANALCQLEEETGLTYPEMLAQLQHAHPPRRLLMQFLRAALVDPPDVPMAAILRDIGGQKVIRAAVKAGASTTRHERRES